MRNKVVELILKACGMGKVSISDVEETPFVDPVGHKDYQFAIR